MRTASFLVNDFGRVFAAGVDGQVRAHFSGQLQLFIVNVKGDHFGVKHVFGVLQRQIAEAAEAIDGDPLAGFDMGDFYRFIGRYARAGDAAGCR